MKILKSRALFQEESLTSRGHRRESNPLLYVVATKSFQARVDKAELNSVSKEIGGPDEWNILEGQFLNVCAVSHDNRIRS